MTIAGESAGGLSVLAHLVSRGSRGLFQRAIVQSGAFALNQQPLAAAEAAGESFAAAAGCPDQTARCLRQLPVSNLLYPGAAIPGVIDGKVLTESIGAALAAGRFARVPVLNGVNHDENRLFVTLGFPVVGGTNVPIPETPVTPDNYQRNIAAVLGVSATRAAAGRGRVPARGLRLRTGRVQHARLGRGLRLPGGPGRPLDVAVRADVRLPVRRRRRTARVHAARLPAGGGHARRRAAVPLRPSPTPGSRHRSTPPSSGWRPRCAPPGRASPRPATRPQPQCPGRPSTRVRTSSRSCRHSHRSSRASPRRTTARSGR